MPRKGFRSAFAAGHVSPADVLAFHRLVFGETRMDADPPAPADPPTPTPSAPTPPAPVDAPGTFTDPETGETYQFPKDTPLADMTEGQRTEYWRHKARKHEGAAKSRADYDAIKAERDQLKASGMTDAEKAIEQARTDAAAAAKAEARTEFTTQLVKAKIEVALAPKLPADKIAGLVEFLDASKFLTEAGEVDTDKVQQYAAGIAPSGGQWPDMGGGSRGGSGKSSGLDAGRDLYAERHKKSKQPS